MTTDDVAAAVIKRMIGKVVIHRLDAYSTNSIYLKFDYGIVNSLRISDHEGEKHLSYRYNILLDQQVREVRHMNGYDRIFYPPSMLDRCCDEILAAKEKKLQYYADYEAVMKKVRRESAYKKGFWQKAWEVYPDEA